MSSLDRWKEISALYASALEVQGADREAFLATACAADDALRRELESLLECHDEAQQLLTSPAVQIMAATMETEATSLVGRHLGAYRIDAAIGAGGMGEVYRATDTRLGREVALKILPHHLRSDPALRTRFEREAQAVASLRHPHICVLHDIGQADDIDFLVMELLDGETLADRLARGPLPVSEALARGLEIADALGATHRRGLVHRDLKPGNVMLTESGAKLLDFGLVKLQEPTAPADDSAVVLSGTWSSLALVSTTAAGTLPYMTPEQIGRKDITPRSDIFAFGVLLYEMVTGRKLFDGPNPEGVAEAIRRCEAPRLAADLLAEAPGLEVVIRKCLRSEPAERWQDVSTMARALRVVDTSAKLPPGAGEGSWKRRSLALLAFATVVTGITAGCFYLDVRPIRSELSAIGAVTAESSTSAVAFRDHQIAQSIARSLSHLEHVQTVCLYVLGLDGVFASFARTEAAGCPQRPPLRGRIAADVIEHVTPVRLQGRELGSLLITRDLSDLHFRFAIACVTIAGLSLGFLRAPSRHTRRRRAGGTYTYVPGEHPAVPTPGSPASLGATGADGRASWRTP